MRIAREIVTAERGGGATGGRPAVDAADDARLLTRSASGDAVAFRILVDRHLSMVVAVARRILGDDAEAEDVAQDVMLRLWNTSDALDVAGHGLRPWLRRVTTNLAIDRFRIRRRTDVTDEVPEVPEAPTQERGLVENDLSARVEAAMRALPDRQRTALALFHFEGKSQSEVAAVLAISDEAVESLLSRARRALKAALKDEWRDLLPDAES